MKISVIGMGNVGLSAALVFSEIGYEIICIDNNEDKISGLNDGILPIYESEFQSIFKSHKKRLKFTTSYKKINDVEVFFVCVGTLPDEKGHLDIIGIVEVCQNIKNKTNNQVIICIRSTIPPGTCEIIDNTLNCSRITLTTNPEFLSQGTAIEDDLENGTRIDRLLKYLSFLFNLNYSFRFNI